jgi:phospholipid/cholesterol/gamma-HCH transport system substrate-binding protein
MNEGSNKRAIAVGIFIFLGLAFLLGGVLTIGNLHSTFQKKLTISTVFGDVNGLASGDNIWFSGVKIGTVKKTEFYGKSQVKVILNINTESKKYIRKDAKVKISTDGLIGNKILVIYDGSQLYPEIEEGDTLSNETMLSTEEIMATLQQNNINILALTKKLSSGEGTIGKLIKDEAIYNSLASASQAIKNASIETNNVVNSLSTFSSNLNKKGTLINNLTTDTIVFSSLTKSILNLNKVSDTASVFINDLQISVKNKNTSIGMILNDEETGIKLKSTLNNLESSSLKLDQNLEALQHNFLFRK